MPITKNIWVILIVCFLTRGLPSFLLGIAQHKILTTGDKKLDCLFQFQVNDTILTAHIFLDLFFPLYPHQ